MTAATGIHDHPAKKLGLKPTTVPDEHLLQVGWKTAAVPDYPPAADYMSHVVPGLDDNDQYGDCGPTSVDNHERITTLFEDGQQVDATLDEVFDLYRHSGCPDFDPETDADDNGVEMAVLLKAARDVGLGGRKIAAYGKLRDISFESVCAAIAVFGAVLMAVDLQVAQQDQTDVWDYEPGSEEWGGHAICAGRYDTTVNSGMVWVFSWGQMIGMTKQFIQNQLMEVWIPLWPSILTSDKFNQSVAVDELAADFRSLTGATLPIPAIPPAPEPTPYDPQPRSYSLSDLVVMHITSAADRRELSPDAWLEHHLRSWFRLTQP